MGPVREDSGRRPGVPVARLRRGTVVTHTDTFRSPRVGRRLEEAVLLDGRESLRRPSVSGSSDTSRLQPASTVGETTRTVGMNT